MSYRGSPVDIVDWLRKLDEEIRSIKALSGQSRIPSTRIGGYIVEIDGVIDPDGPLIKLTEVATGIVTYCCNTSTGATCREIPPFSWFGLVTTPDEFPAYPLPETMLLVEAAVVMQNGQDVITFDIKLNDAVITTVVADDVSVQRYDIAVTGLTNERLSVELTDIGAGACEDLTIVLRTCVTPEVFYEA